MLASEIMTSPPVTIHQGRSLADAARLIVAKRISGLPIIDDSGRLVGILTSTDLAPRSAEVPHSDVRALQVFQRWLGPGGIDEAYAEAEKILLRDVMNRDPVVAGRSDPIERVATLMLENRINHIPIVEDGLVIGIVSRHDFLRLAARR